MLDRANRGDKRLTWQNWGLAIAKLNIPGARETASAENAEAQLQVAVPREWTTISPLPATFAGEPSFPAG